MKLFLGSDVRKTIANQQTAFTQLVDEAIALLSVVKSQYQPTVQEMDGDDIQAVKRKKKQAEDHLARLQGQQRSIMRLPSPQTPPLHPGRPRFASDPVPSCDFGVRSPNQKVESKRRFSLRSVAESADAIKAEIDSASRALDRVQKQLHEYELEEQKKVRRMEKYFFECWRLIRGLLHIEGVLWMCLMSAHPSIQANYFLSISTELSYLAGKLALQNGPKDFPKLAARIVKLEKTLNDLKENLLPLEKRVAEEVALARQLEARALQRKKSGCLIFLILTASAIGWDRQLSYPVLCGAALTVVMAWKIAQRIELPIDENDPTFRMISVGGVLLQMTDKENIAAKELLQKTREKLNIEASQANQLLRRVH